MGFFRAAAFMVPLLLAANSVAGPATPKPDSDEGRALAERVCVSCHVISKHETSSHPAAVAGDVPSFPAIADKPGQSMEAIAGRIVIPHPPMIAIPLTRQEIADVVAYIMSLKGSSESTP